jgi:hypothetical protein
VLVHERLVKNVPRVKKKKRTAAEKKIHRAFVSGCEGPTHGGSVYSSLATLLNGPFLPRRRNQTVDSCPLRRVLALAEPPRADLSLLST